jgi:hypothetical protein
MPTVEHDALAELFRFQPALAVALLRDVLGRPIPTFASFDLPETDFSQTMTTEYRADRVVVLKDARGKAVLAVIVEIQRAIDEEKKRSWPVYVTVQGARLDCDAVVLVLCLDEHTARWAAEPIHLGFEQVILPQVVGPSVLPVIRSRRQARSLPELAVLSAMTHGNKPAKGLDAVLAAFVAMANLDDERARLYLDLILARLDKKTRRALEAMTMQKYEYQSEFAKKYYGQGKQEGFAEGLSMGKAEGKAEGEARGKAEGEAKGKAKGEAQAILAVLEARGLEVPAKVRKVVLSCTDLAQLDAWVRAAVSVPSAEALLVPATPSPAARKTRSRRPV